MKALCYVDSFEGICVLASEIEGLRNDNEYLKLCVAVHKKQITKLEKIIEDSEDYICSLEQENEELKELVEFLTS